MEIGHLECCGIKELIGISGHRSGGALLRAILEVAQESSYEDDDTPWSGNFRYAIFSQASNGKYGKKFAVFIREHNLGEVIETGTHINPNSGNLLKMWVWTVDHDAVRNWSSKYGKAKAKTAKKASVPRSAESQGPQNPTSRRA
jgi:hypothetical protein